MDSKKYIGMDVHQATISVAVRDAAGKLVMESIVETKAATILQLIQGIHGSLWVTFEEGTSAAYGADIVIDGIGGDVLSQALGALAFEGSLTTLGYSASRQTTIDVTNLIVPQASIRSLNMFTQPKGVV